MATTITRESMTDGTTVWNVARIHSAIYDRIDALIANTITFGGLVHSEAFGIHQWVGSGPGEHGLLLRNPSSSASSFARLMVANDASTAVELTQFSSGYTQAGYNHPNGSRILASGAGGLSIAADHANGEIRFYQGGSVLAARIGAGNRTWQVGYGLWFTGSYNQTITGTQALDAAGQYYTVIRITSASSSPTISNCTPGNQGDVKILINVSGTAVTVTHNSGVPTQRMMLANATNGALGDREAMMLIYDAGTSSWIEIGPR